MLVPIRDTPQSVPGPETRLFFIKVFSTEVKNDLVEGQGTDQGVSHIGTNTHQGSLFFI